jgi:hypothetical protein
MLASLRHHAFVGGDDEQREIDPLAPTTMLRTKSLVSRHVDPRSSLPASKAARIELYGDSASLFFGRRSVSTPVRAFTSRVLPWST